MWNTSGPTTSSQGGWSDPYGGDLAPTHMGMDSDVFWGSGGRARLTSTQERIGQSTSKIPPFWEPTLELRGYPI